MTIDIRTGANIRAHRQRSRSAQPVVELYGAAIVCIEGAIKGHQRDDLGLMRSNLLRAQVIVSNLRAAIDRDTGAVADDLDRMYDLLYRKLSQAQLHHDPNVAQEVLGYLTEMLATWQYIIQEATAGTGAPPTRKPKPAVTATRG
jgi:flagellar secretion chaperone FliS